MTDKNYITPSQYEKIVRKMKEYVDKSIPHIKTQELFTLSADKVLEIYNSDSKMMEFDKPSNIISDGNFIVNYNNKDINTNIKTESSVKYILCKDNNINIVFVLGVNANDSIDENKMVVLIQMLNTGITTTDVILKQQDIKLLNNKYLKDDVAIKNSITIGSRDAANNIGQYSFSNGKWTTASGDYSHAEGFDTVASGFSSHAEGNSTTASEENSHAEGNGTAALGSCSHAEGYITTASGFYSHAEGFSTIAEGDHSHAEGSGTTAKGEDSHAEGCGTKAFGGHSHAEGNNTKTPGFDSHAEGCGTTASGYTSHAEGFSTKAEGYYSHAEGSETNASGECSHAEGDSTIAKGQNQHVEGKFNVEDTANAYAHIVGNGSSNSARSNAHTLDWSGNAWFAGQVEGTNLPYHISSKKLATVPANDINNIINSDNGIAVNNISINNNRRYYIEFLGITKLCSLSLDDEDENVIICSINNYKIKVYNGSANIIISISKINDDIVDETFTDLIIYEEENNYLDSKYLEYDLILQNSISLGRVGNIGPGSSAIGYDVRASGYYSHAEGEGTKASGDDSHAEGYNTTASGGKSHAEGASTTASGWSSHAEGNHTTASGESSHAEGYTTTASGDYSHAEGNVTKASAFCSHAEGNHTTASGDDSHAEGFYTTASASGSHAEGVSTTASGEHSHAEGDCTTASGSASHAEGQFTIASGEFQHVQGKFNIEDTENKYLHIVGNGKYDDQRSNAHTLDWNGNGWYAGKLSQDGTPTADKDLTTKKYVDDTVGANKVNICADEEITNMLTEVLGVGYSATE